MIIFRHCDFHCRQTFSAFVAAITPFSAFRCFFASRKKIFRADFFASHEPPYSYAGTAISLKAAAALQAIEPLRHIRFYQVICYCFISATATIFLRRFQFE